MNQHHFLRIREFPGLETVEIDPARHISAQVVPTIPGHALGTSGLLTVHQGANELTHGIVNPQFYLGFHEQGISDARNLFPGVGMVLAKLKGTWLKRRRSRFNSKRGSRFVVDLINRVPTIHPDDMEPSCRVHGQSGTHASGRRRIIRSQLSVRTPSLAAIGGFLEVNIPEYRVCPGICPCHLDPVAGACST